MAETETQSNEHVKAFFLDLVAKGKDAWDAWRRDNEHVPVTFAGIDFSEAPNDKINFTGFVFAGLADFSGCTWRSCSMCSTPNDFSLGRTFFTDAYFVDSANFAGADFGAGAKFERAVFGDEVDFIAAIFGAQANFADAEFRGKANFTGAAFGAEVNFTGAVFRDEAKFDEAHFEGRVAFNRERAPFVSISFASTHFDGEANFSGRSFEKSADLTNTRFYYPPDFDGVPNAGKIDFTGARVGFVPVGKWLHWTEDSRIPVRLRAFRKIAEETKNHDLERDLYVQERKAERGAYRRQLIKGLENAPKRRKVLGSRLIRPTRR